MNSSFDWTAILQDPNWITALAGALGAIFLLFMLLVLCVQLGGIKKYLRATLEQTKAGAEAERRRATVEAVRKYESDPELRNAIQTLWTKTKQGTDYTLLEEADKMHAHTLLNYFDGICHGVEHGVLVDDVVREYLRPVVHKAVKALIKGESGDTWISDGPLVDEEGYETLLKMHHRWMLLDNTIYEMLR